MKASQKGRQAWLFCFGVLGILACENASAWIFQEHREIGRAAIDQLDAGSKAELGRIWKAANAARSERLCALPSEPVDAPLSGGAPCADMAMLFALAGDHSCTPAELEQTVLQSDWFPKLASYIQEFKRELKESKDFESKLSLWNDSNVRLLELDEQYLSRAAKNNAHFPIEALPVSERETLEAYLERSTVDSAPINALSIYARFHVAALEYARLGKVTEAVYSEAFAIHFLQDLFSSGHYAGTWGAAAERKGTHDYYSVKGLVTQTWGGQRFSGHGDAYLTPEDIAQSSRAVADSLRQFIQAFSGKGPRPGAAPALELFTRDICKTKTFAANAVLTSGDHVLLKPTLNQLPIPSEGNKGVSLPRYRIETGPFVSLSSGLRFGATSGGFPESAADVSTLRRLELIGRLGIGTAGVLSNHSDGAMFLAFGIVVDGAQYSNPQLAARSGEVIGLRSPFWLIPGDLLLLAPLLYLTDLTSLQNVAISASNGGWLGLQRKIETPFGTLQLMAGRQIGVSLFGYFWNGQPRVSNANGTTLGTYRSIELDFPIIELKAGHSFATKLAFDYSLQLGYAHEIPTSQTSVNLAAGSTVYLRLNLEGLNYW